MDEALQHSSGSMNGVVIDLTNEDRIVYDLTDL